MRLHNGRWYSQEFKNVILPYSGIEFIQDGELLQHIVTSSIYNDLDLLDNLINDLAYKIAEMSVFDIKGIRANTTFDEQYNGECERMLELAIKHWDYINQLVKGYILPIYQAPMIPTVHWAQPNTHYISVIVTGILSE